MQGRLSPPFNNKIQHYPFNNWENEFFLILEEFPFKSIQWVYEKENFLINKLYTDPVIIKKISNETGIKVNSVILDYFMNKNFLSGFKNIEKENIDHLIFIINQCNKANIKNIELPLVDDSSLSEYLKKNDLSNFINFISPVLKVSENLQINFNLETDLDPNTFLDLIKKFHPFKVYVNYDMGNSTSNNIDPNFEIKLLSKYIKNIHIKDRKKDKGPTCPFGQGDTDFFKIFNLINYIDYHGDFIIQGAREDIGLNKNIDFKETIFKYLEFLNRV